MSSNVGRSWFLVSVVACAGLAAGCSDSATQPAAQQPVDRGLIVFPDRRMIWKIQPDGAVPKAVGRDGSQPRLSPDLSRIAFMKDGRPGVSNLDGSGLLYDEEDFAELHGWIDDRTLLVERSDTLFARSLATSDERALYTPDDGAFLLGASTNHPAGQLVVATVDFTSDVSVVAIVELGAAGAGTVDTLARFAGDYTFHPQFAPDGRRVVVQRSGIDVTRGAITIIEVVDGSRRDVRPPEPAYGYRWPTWTPDGDSLIVNRFRTEPPFSDASDLVVVSTADGGSRVLLADREGLLERPDWKSAR